jgi:hypothetical protein
LWKWTFYLCRNASKEEIHDVGGAIIVVRAYVHYFKFPFVDSIQHWSAKWFYVRDQKSSEEQQYGLAPFDLKKKLKKLKTWDQISSEAELEALMTRIMKLKTAVNKEMNGVQLIAYFLQNHIQPLKVRVSQMWNYFGSKHKLRNSEEDVPKEILQKQVRSLTMLTKNDVIPPCPATPYSASKPLPKV